MADQERKAILNRIMPLVLAGIEHATADTSSSESEDETVNYRGEPRDLPKSRHYFHIVEEMDETEFHSHFRLGRREYYFVSDDHWWK